MPGTPGARTGLAQILPTGEAPSILHTTINSIVSWLEGNAAITSFGTLATRPTSSPGTPGIAGRRYRATDAFATFRDTGTGWELEAQTPQVVTALPTGTGIPFDGQEILFLADATGGVVWPLRYRAGSASTHRWEAVGDPTPLRAVRDNDETFTADNTWRNPSTAGPSVTLPLPGDYLVDGLANLYAGAPSSLSVGVESGAGPAPGDFQTSYQGTTGAGMTIPVEARLVDKAAGTVVRLQYEANAGGTANARWRKLSVRPVRVG